MVEVGAIGVDVVNAVVEVVAVDVMVLVGVFIAVVGIEAFRGYCSWGGCCGLCSSTHYRVPGQSYTY